ncbi:hypothetical protein Pmani_010860 [Petrolisthes manimaculis]|uniref:Uncharacterized protein n=1 Tax=Petrolisthes manimaculis TaxID=1843537 RepID=A0AAE1Q1B1_9EUCA|nr:hypothetical protein Pmani_010860 [Petrolisthes manimaculis]
MPLFAIDYQAGQRHVPQREEASINRITRRKIGSGRQLNMESLSTDELFLCLTDYTCVGNETFDSSMAVVVFLTDYRPHQSLVASPTQLSLILNTVVRTASSAQR